MNQIIESDTTIETLDEEITDLSDEKQIDKIIQTKKKTIKQKELMDDVIVSSKKKNIKQKQSTNKEVIVEQTKVKKSTITKNKLSSNI